VKRKAPESGTCPARRGWHQQQQRSLKKTMLITSSPSSCVSDASGHHNRLTSWPATFKTGGSPERHACHAGPQFAVEILRENQPPDALVTPGRETPLPPHQLSLTVRPAC
jgi:hypothetical protein